MALALTMQAEISTTNMNLPIGTLLQGGKYEIKRFISAGGFGCTYEGVPVEDSENIS